MCGITGIFYRNGRPVDAERLGVMTDTLQYRGPDDRGVWAEGPIGLGHRRLSIRDLSAAGHQPMADPSGRIVVTFNGEIYNDAALRHELQRDFGYSFRTSSDTEILPLGYLAWGADLFRRLEGMFAIGLWDRQERRLLLARDGIGIKPLFYCDDPAKIVFGSELKAILASGECPRTLDPASLHVYLAAGYPGPDASLVQNIRQLPPGTYLSFGAYEKEEQAFWRPHRSGALSNPQEAEAGLIERLRTVVESQLVSDVPIGVLQSGGIDSTLISMTLKTLDAHPPLFTAAFNDRSHDESDLAADVARAAGLPHHLIPMDADPDPVATVRALAYHGDGQCADTGAYAFYRLCGEVRKHSTVVLSGDGGDEFFAGYDTYRASQMAQILQPWLPAALLKQAGRTLYNARPGDETRLPLAAVMARFALGMGYGGKNAHMQWRRLVPAFLLPPLYGAAMREYAALSPYHDYEAFAEHEKGADLDRWLIADQRFHLQSVLMKVDRMSMAHGLEIRVPLLDRGIMDFAGDCALSLLRSGGTGKALLRSTARRLGAPPSVIDAKKRGFNVPLAAMLRQKLTPLCNHWFEKEADILEPYLQADAIRTLWREHKSIECNHAYALWPILILAEWLGQS